ncbi:carboxymuconolactone decarboxylase family protein [Polaromonas sp. JS666]|uniref:carboxymuconolactone decarboxylase family protein n=1 Tax=Polaromonas sp. (strain JS666 / ATCC BAA-500) TaxID=296591 RepID=UPI0000538062|nr:carboxymuconolactone decarboxylase family protein [Polaromonas sp. JS666]ABE42483.1 Alkylhydroperoxidase AhpD core [Polaromonas sp. JS666]
MSRLHTPASIGASPVAAQAALNAIDKQLGLVPNLFRVVANSPAALQGYVDFNSAASKGKLSAQTRERIALAVAEINGCGYCLAAHTYLAGNVAKLDEAEIVANRKGASNDPKADKAVRFAAQVVHNRGHVSDNELATVREAGYDDAEIVEIVLAVALNTFTNYLNEVAGTQIDFPATAPLVAAS